jgi:pyruvate/2-oxoglutarate dehydrogenase complex dihydrolipoamide acyltransferase (E2) component
VGGIVDFGRTCF